MFKYFSKKSAIIIIFATLFLILESFVAIIETDFIRALMYRAVYPDPNNVQVPNIQAPGTLVQVPIDSVINDSNITSLYNLGPLNLSLLTFVILLFGVLFGGLGVWMTSKAVAMYITEMRRRVYEKIQKFSFEDIDKFSASSLLTRLTTDTELIYTSVSFAAKFMIAGVFSIIFGIIKSAIQYSDWVIIYAIVIPLLIVFIGLIIAFSTPYMRKGQQYIDGINKQVRESILGIRVVKAYNLESKQKSKFEIPNEKLTQSWFKGYSLIGMLFPVLQCVVTGMMIFIYFITWNKYDNMSAAGQLIGFSGILMQVLFGFIIIIVSIAQISRSIPCVKRINEVTKFTPSLTFDNSSTKKITKGVIEFKNVSHSFLKDDTHLIIKNINLKINDKEKIGIIGGTGSGKSTLVNLIGRLFDCSKGQVLIDGIDVKEFSFNEINSNVAIAMQSALLFSGTIKSNIALGLDENLSAEELEKEAIKAAKVAEAWEFISKKPDKLNSIVEQRGKNFSGGQKQRISIARTIAKKSKIIIFDDSTSALDTITEKKVQSNIKKYNDATTIVVAQRISSVEELDRIIVMNNGEIVGYDTHWNLLANNETYRSIAASQLGTEELNVMLKERGLRQIEKNKQQ